MIIHPTRTNLLHLKDKKRSVANSIGILKARRQALIREFLQSTKPFLQSRRQISATYRRAIDELRLALAREGPDYMESLTVASRRRVAVTMETKNTLGVRYREVRLREGFVRAPWERNYDFVPTTPHLEESTHLFEEILESLIQIAAFENKLKRLGEEILRVTRRMRVLEERVFPSLSSSIRTIGQFLGERDREAHFRLKKFKELRERQRESRLGDVPVNSPP